MPETPVIENIHTKMLEAVSKEGALNMETWHTDSKTNEEGAYCGTTHCRAGWVIALGGKAGRELETIFGTENAALQIYKASSSIPVGPVRFYEDNEKAMEDIKRCAELEKELTK